MYKVIIIGGMAAGCKAAARLSRISSDYQITVIERKPFVSFGNCGLPLYASGEIDNYLDLSKTAYGVIRDVDYFRDVKGVNVLTETVVEKINTENCEVKCKCLKSKDKFTIPYDKLIIATGSRAIEPKFTYPSSSRISSFYSPGDAQNFRKVAQKGSVRKAVIIGGGFIGCELTEALSSLWGIETILIEKEEYLLSKFLDPEISRLIENRIKENDIEVFLSVDVKGIEIDEKESPVVILKDGKKIEADYVFYNLGVKPDSHLAKVAGINTGVLGGITVDNMMKTNIKNVWAAGDCVEVNNLVTGKPDYFSLGSLSNRMGRVVAGSIAGEDISFKGAVGTVSLKIFDMIASVTGLTEKEAKAKGYDTGSVIGGWTDRPDYHPDSKDLYGKLIYEKPGLRLLGFQLVGEGEVNRYVDVVSGLLSNQKTVYDLLDLEHGYTPAHSSPVSPLNFLGYIVLNQEEASVKNYPPSQLSLFDGIFIDLRESTEIDKTGFKYKAIHIPISELRNKLDQLELDQPIMFICEKGPRAYEAAKIFMNYGYKNISYLGAGNSFYKEIIKDFDRDTSQENVNDNSLSTLS
jgi:NADPH-dependent 2,4-dienoyl-CoA reductase/sulfur reductase-like enzyme/rhodanese-related sulfurtransferase